MAVGVAGVACHDDRVIMPITENFVMTRRSAIRGTLVDTARQPLDSFRVYVVGGGIGRYSSEGADITDAEGHYSIVVNEVDGIIRADSAPIFVVVEPIRPRDKAPAGPHRLMMMERKLWFTPSALPPRNHDFTITSPQPR